MSDRGHGQGGDRLRPQASGDDGHPQAIVELEMDRGEPDRAVGVLETLLEKVHDLGSRTAIRFALKDLYMETRRPDDARQQMVELILENAHDTGDLRTGSPARPPKAPRSDGPGKHPVP